MKSCTELGLGWFQGTLEQRKAKVTQKQKWLEEAMLSREEEEQSREKQR